MNGIVRAILMGLAVATALTVAARAFAQETLSNRPDDAAAVDLQRVLVLQDGGVLIGELRQEGDRYFVKRGSVEMQVRKENVMLIASSLDDAYEQRRKQSGQGTAASHLQLAKWCLRYNLLEPAAAELKIASELEPYSGRLALLNRRLALAREQANRPKTLAGRSEAAADITAEPPVSQRPATIEHATIGDLPPGAVERFTRHVQPVLVNSCSMAGCHQQGGKEKFQLDRAILHGMANRRSTMQNLAATLALVDRENPELSQLLTVPRQRHGGMEEPVFGPRQEAALRHLVEWVALVSDKPPRRDEAVTQTEHVAENDSDAGPLASPITPRGLGESSQSGDDWQLELAEAEFRSPTRAPIQYGAELKRWTPRDPFDPEIFNRQSAQKPADVTNPQ